MNRTESFSPGFCEYLVPGFVGKKLTVFRILGIVLGIALTTALFSLIMVMPQVIFIWLVVIIFLEVMLFRFTSREFEYTIITGELNVDIIYGKRLRRRVATVKLREAESIFPISGFNDNALSRLKNTKILYLSPKKSDYMYCLYTKNIDGKSDRTAIVFSSCKKMSDAIRFYNRAAFNENK